MSRSGYSDEPDNYLSYGRWRGQVASAIRGERGQGLLRELAEALDAMPVKRLVAYELEKNGEVCALGCVGVKRGVDMKKLDPEDPRGIADAFGVARQLVQEIEYVNDEEADYLTPEQRWRHIRDWVARNLRAPSPSEKPISQPQTGGEKP